MTARDVIARLSLEPHPEGGWFRETWRGPDMEGRSSGTAILFLLDTGERSHWHKVDAAEIWHHYAGAPLALSTYEGGAIRTRMLGPDLDSGQFPQLIVPTDIWQAAKPVGGWGLVGCTVSPGFSFDGFTLAPPGWSPDQ